ncbi:NUDIX domain-containing protein [Rothia sp. HC945]|uniref:(deoxy)nucleoside triphosphate pyrophosphohydrolase n=1 Tax=Rothia sp. HC945 TaxID=3171170 RepID=UPI002657266E|nr:NUDIX domain-containing protein [Kocuria sp.]MDN5655936.1 NUDIX domain-containing protein [Kocuria sp.]
MTEKTYPVQVVGAALVDDLDEPAHLLVACRSAPEALAGLWEFPGGKAEPGEDAVTALRRELREELGVDIDLGAEIPGPQAQGWPLTERMAMRVFWGSVSKGVPEPLEDHSELRWMNLSDVDGLRNLGWIPADLPIVEALVHRVS